MTPRTGTLTVIALSTVGAITGAWLTWAYPLRLIVCAEFGGLCIGFTVGLLTWGTSARVYDGIYDEGYRQGYQDRKTEDAIPLAAPLCPVCAKDAWAKQAGKDSTTQPKQ